MKKLGYIIISFALVLSSCLKEEGPGRDNGGTTIPEEETSEELVEKIITVTAPQTRTSLSGTNVVWTEGDQIAVWDGYACRKFVMTGAPKGNKAEFRGFVRHNSPKEGSKYYALYPYSETFITEIPPTVADEINKELGYARMLFPFNSEQRAVPGNFDKDAAYAIAESDDIENMTFDQRTSLLRFRLADDMGDVVSVKISGNESNDYIWGTMSMRFVEGGLLYPGVVNNSAVNPDGRGREIILKNDDGSPLQTGVDYYMVIPATLFGRGYKLTFVHEDGTTSSRSSAKSVEYNTTHIYDLAPKAISSSMLHSYKDDYQSNEKITICGYDIKSQYFGKPILITSDQEYTITQGGSYFIEPGARVTLDTGNTPVDKLMIVGDSKFERSQVRQVSNVKLNDMGYFTVLNIDLEFTDGFNMVEPSANVKWIEFERCIIRYNSSKSIINSNTAGFERFVLYHNDIIFTQNTNIHFTSSGKEGTPFYKEVIFDNNLFYHTGSYNAAEVGFMLLAGNAANKKINQLVLDHNTFVNLKVYSASPYYIGGAFSDLVDKEAKKYVHHNLFYMPNLSAGDNYRLLANAYSSGCDEYGVTYYTGTSAKFKYSNHDSPVSGQDKNKEFRLDANPFKTIDPANGIFEKGPSLFLSDGTEIGAVRPVIID